MYCPFCNDSKGHLWYNDTKDVYHCWKCGKAGKGRPSGRVKMERPESAATLIQGLPPDSIPLWKGSRGIISRRAYQYLIDRGLTVDDITKYQVHRAGSYVVFPFFDGLGELKYWVARAFTKLDRRYTNCPIPRPDVIFSTGVPAVGGFVVEGIFKAIRVGKFYPAIALLGKEMSEAQEIRIKLFFREWVIVLLDHDAVTKSMEIWNRLRGNRFCHIEFYRGDIEDIPGPVLAKMVEGVIHADIHDSN